MKRRKFGVYFEKDFVFLQYLIERYEIKYSDIEKKYILKILLEIILLKEVAEVHIHLDRVI